MGWLRMSGTRKLGFTGLILVLGTGALCWASMRASSSSRSPHLRKADVVHRIEPQTFTAAEETCPIPLPGSASNVQHAVWSFGQVTQVWVRFEAPVADCLNHAQQMVQPYSEKDGWTVTTTTLADDPGLLCVLDPTAVDLSWFDLDEIAGGLVFRVDGGRAPVIWADTNRGGFYCEQKNSRHSMDPR